jgi:hypothetical protein
MHMVFQANSAGMKEILTMSEAAFEAVLEEHGLISKWRKQGLERGLEKGLENAVRKLRKHGMDPAEIAEALELPLDTVFGYLKAE